MKTRLYLLSTVLLLVCCCVAIASAQQQRLMGTIIVDRAPVTLAPEPGRTPLVTLDAGTQVRVLGAEKNGWYQIAFQHGYLFGERIGYVRAEHLTVATLSTAPGSSLAIAEPSNGAAASADAARLSSRHIPSKDRISAAILAGQRQKGRTQGLGFLDTGQTWTELPTPGEEGPAASARFRLRIHTPLTWIRQLASDAAREDRSFDLNDVTDEMTAPVLRVTASSAVPDTATPSSPAGTSWVRHVVLRSVSRTVSVQPLSKEAFTEHVVNATGGRAVSEGLRLMFSLDALRRLRGPRGDAEFLITVIGAGGEEKNIRVTKKHFADLPM